MHWPWYLLRIYETIAIIAFYPPFTFHLSYILISVSNVMHNTKIINCKHQAYFN